MEEDDNEESIPEEQRNSETFHESSRLAGWEVEVALLNPAIIKKTIHLITQLRFEELDDELQLYKIQ